MSELPGRPKMRAGMTLGERQRLRAWILDSALDQARRQAAEVHLSIRCRSHLEQRSPSMNAAERMAEHALCKTESMGDGCLCPMHDPDDELKAVRE